MELPFEYSDRGVVVLFYRALGMIRGVDKASEADTGKYKYNYQTLDDVLGEVHRACRQNALEVTQIPGAADTMLTMTNVLVDAEGETLTFAPMCLPMPREAQALGSAVTYLKRYSLVAQFGIIVPGEDDDGHAATVAAQVSPGRRTEAERLIRESMTTMTEAQRKTFANDFKAEFNSTLTDLPANRHGQALTWSKEWIAAWIEPSTEPMPPDVPVAQHYLDEHSTAGPK